MHRDGPPGPPGPDPAPATGRNQSSSLRRALAVLGYIRDRDGHPASLTRIAEDLGLSKSTVLRLAAPLLEENLLARDRDTGRFRLGHGALHLGQAYLSSIDVRAVAAEPLRRLQRAVDETCHLVLYEAPDVVYIDKVENARNVRMASRVGSRMPAYRTAVGKAVLAWLGDDAIDLVVAAGLPAVTEHTVTDPAALRADLAQVRRRGYSVDDRENEPEVRCVGAAVFDHTDTAVAAVSVSGLASRMTPARIREVGPLATRTALEISRVLGFTGRPDRQRGGASRDGADPGGAFQADERHDDGGRPAGHRAGGRSGDGEPSGDDGHDRERATT